MDTEKAYRKGYWHAVTQMNDFFETLLKKYGDEQIDGADIEDAGYFMIDLPRLQSITGSLHAFEDMVQIWYEQGDCETDTPPPALMTPLD